MNNQIKILKKGWRIAILFLISILVFTNCGVLFSSSKNLSNFDWLIGTWEVNDGAYFEKWEKINDQYFSGKSYKLQAAKDTLVLETIQLLVKENEVFYIPTVRSQNDNQPIEFILTSETKNDFIFENPEHDFPKKIKYSRIDEQTVKVQISDKKKKIDFDLKKIN